MSTEQTTRESRASIIETVQTPLGFFALVVLVVEVILGITAGLVRGVDPTWVVAAMVGLIFLLVFIVAALAYVRPEALHGKRAADARSTTPTVQLDSAPSVEHVTRPTILCASTVEFEALGAEDDATILRQHFPKQTVVEHGITLERFRGLLTSRQFDILHILCYVDAEEGSLRFGPNERLSPEGLERLTAVCGARLVVLATCDSVVLAAQIAHVANMIAATKSVAINDIVAWAGCFYGLLARGQPVSRSYEVARATTDAPMVLLLKREMTFQP
jgi:hypothetical protein